jgi:hypothetical protein
MKLSALPCTHCQGHGLEGAGPSAAACRFCGALNPLDGLLCPRCDFVNAAGAEACANCRQTLSRRCPDCAAANWIGAERCANCGRALDALTHITSRYGVDPAHYLNALARDSAAIKAREAADSQVRMGRLEASEQRRQAALADARRRRDAQQRLLALGLAAVVVVALIVVAVMVTISLSAN